MNDNEIIQQYKKYEPIFGSWYIKRFVGEGGFAKVFEIGRTDFGAEYTSALKIITVSKTKSELNTLRSEGMIDEDIREYLLGIVEDTVSEIKLMYKLRGRGNIVIYEDHVVMEHEDGMGWDILIKMEYLTSLSTFIRQQNGCVAKRDIIKLGIDICKSLESCQKYNIIHRDIKADNIFISDDGEFKLGDFGIARVIERKDQTLSKKGTSAYMAPEIYKGQTYTSAVDIYSLGMVMYRLMNNNRGPFLPPYPQSMSLDDRDHAMMLRMSGEKFPKPNQVTRGRLVEIVLKACSYRPEERYSSPGFMRRELEVILLDLDEMTTDEWVMIYDIQRGRTSAALSSAPGQSGTSVSGSPILAEVKEAVREEGAAEVLRETNAAGAFREEGATEVLREEGATEELREEDATEVLQEEDAAGILREESVLSQIDVDQTVGSRKDALPGVFRKILVIGGICAAFVILVIFIGEAAKSVRNPTWDEYLQTQWSENVMMKDVQNDIDGNSVIWGSEIKRKEILTVTFLDSLDTMPDDAWDVSEDKSGRVMAWVIPRNDIYNLKRYDLYIGGEGGVATDADCDRMFGSYTHVEKIQMNGNLHTEEVTSMSQMFSDCENLASVDLSSLDTSNVMNMSEMFSGCRQLTNIDLSGIDTTNVTNMRAMFKGCTHLTSLDLSGLDISNVEDMWYMFKGCTSLTSLDLSGLDASSVTNMQGMFYGCRNLVSVDLSGLDISSVEDMRYMFDGCENLTSLDLSDIVTPSVTNMQYMFNGCENLTGLDLSDLDTSNVTDMSYMFKGCTRLNSLDLKGFNTSSVTDMSYMFGDCTHLTSLDLSGFNTSNVTDMSNMFYDCTCLTSLDLNGFDTSNVTDMTYMFGICERLTSLDLSGFDTSNVKNMHSMLWRCYGLTELYVGDHITQDQLDETGYESQKVTVYRSAPGGSTQQAQTQSPEPSSGGTEQPPASSAPELSSGTTEQLPASSAPEPERPDQDPPPDSSGSSESRPDRPDRPDRPEQ